MSTIATDGTLTEQEALDALKHAALAATEALPKALAKCSTDEQRTKVMNDRDTVLLAFLNALDKSLINTSAMFEKIANDLESEAQSVMKRKDKLKNAAEAIGLLSDLVGLAASLALAFA